MYANVSDIRLLQKIDYYKNIFNIEKYYKHKNNYLKNLKNTTPYQQEIIQLYKNK